MLAKGWLLNEATGKRIEFQFNPEIQDEKSTRYEHVTIPGVSHPFLQYVAGESRTLHFQLELNGVGNDRDIYQDVLELQALQYPTWLEGQLRATPPRVILAFGSLFYVRGVVTHVGILYRQWSGDFKRLLRATATVDLEEYSYYSIDLEAVTKRKIYDERLAGVIRG